MLYDLRKLIPRGLKKFTTRGAVGVLPTEDLTVETTENVIGQVFVVWVVLNAFLEKLVQAVVPASPDEADLSAAIAHLGCRVGEVFIDRPLNSLDNYVEIACDRLL